VKRPGKTGKMKNPLEDPFMQRFESNEQLRERLGQLTRGNESPGESGNETPDGNPGRLPAVEEMHARLLSGIQGKITNPTLPVPAKNTDSAAKDEDYVQGAE